MDQLWQRMANLVFEMEKKNRTKDGNPSMQRVLDKMKLVIEDAGLFLYDPAGEKYAETRTDVEASISGDSAHNLVIKEVIKPVLYGNDKGKKVLLQKGVVIVSGQ